MCASPAAGAVAERPPCPPAGPPAAPRASGSPRRSPRLPGKVLSQPLQMFRAGGIGLSALCYQTGARGAHFPRCDQKTHFDKLWSTHGVNCLPYFCGDESKALNSSRPSVGFVHRTGVDANSHRAG
ncbi:hypothetical protein NN561_002149 [Cricetulus griseus]